MYNYNIFLVSAILTVTTLLGGCNATMNSGLGWGMYAGQVMQSAGIDVTDLFKGEPSEYHRDILTIEDGDIAGFRGVGWGDAPKADMQLVQQEELAGKTVAIYRRASEQMKIGKAELLQVEYTFLEDRFIQAEAVTGKSRNGQELRRIITARYGKPMAPDNLETDPLKAEYTVDEQIDGALVEKLAVQHWRAENGYIAMDCLWNKREDLEQDQCAYTWSSWAGKHANNTLKQEALKNAASSF